MKKLNRKGFTLVELLAVIVVLALIMVFAIPTVLDASGKAHQKAFKLFADKVLVQAQTHFALNGLKDGSGCENLAGMGMTGITDYAGRVVAATSDGKITYTLYLTDDTYEYKGVASTASAPEERTSTSATKDTYNKCS